MVDLFNHCEIRKISRRLRAALKVLALGHMVISWEALVLVESIVRRDYPGECWKQRRGEG